MSDIPQPLSAFEGGDSKGASNGRDSSGRFLKGSRHSSGRPKGSRVRLSEKFFAALHDDFEENGVAAIARVRFHDPSTYLQVIAKLMPTKIEHSTPLDGLSDERIAEMIAELEHRMGLHTIDATPVAVSPMSLAPPTSAEMRAAAVRRDLEDQAEEARRKELF